MDYYIREIQISNKNTKTAGIKARDDLESVFEDEGMQAVLVSSKDEKRESIDIIRKSFAHVKVAHIWGKKTAVLNKGDTVFIQFPVEEHTLFLSNVIDRLKRKGVRIVLFIHDLELLRYTKRRDFSYARRLRIYLEEKTILKKADCIVVHNQKMKAKLAETAGIGLEKMISLELFDYLIPDFEVKEGGQITKEGPIIVSGNLHPDKAGYIYDLPESVKFNLYGVNYIETGKDNIRYCGSFFPNEIPFAMSGSFGLVWDGDSSDTCRGVFGDYLRYNNPHKTSLYLACGIPVIIWENAALADYIRKHKVGFTVNSLDEIDTILGNMKEEEYNEYKRNALTVSEELRSGQNTKAVLTALKLQ